MWFVLLLNTFASLSTPFFKEKRSMYPTLNPLKTKSIKFLFVYIFVSSLDNHICLVIPTYINTLKYYKIRYMIN